jgi:hypothetical protein
VGVLFGECPAGSADANGGGRIRLGCGSFHDEMRGALRGILRRDADVD